MRHFLPDGIQIGVKIVNLHAGNPIHINLHIYHEPTEVLMGGNLTQQTVVDRSTFQQRYHLITQMQFVKFCVWVIFLFCQTHEVIGRHAIKFCQRHNAERADVLKVLRLILAQRGLGQSGLPGKLFQSQAALHPQILEPFRNRELCIHFRPSIHSIISVIFSIIARPVHKRGKFRSAA